MPNLRSHRLSRSFFLRFISFLLAVFLLAENYAFPILAEETEWQCGDDTVNGYLCDDCRELFDADEDGEPQYCSVCGDSNTYCEDCFCWDCERCLEHCICDLVLDRPAEYTGDELSQPDIPVPENDGFEELAERTLPDVPTFEKLELDEDNKYPRETWRLFEPFCKASNEKDCIEALKKDLPTYLSVRMLDSGLASRPGLTTPQSRHIRALAGNAAIRKLMTEKMDWSGEDVSYNQKVESLKTLVDILKKQAVEQGLDRDWINMIQVMEKEPNVPEAVMELTESDDPKILYEIRINPELVRKSKDGNYVAQAVAHEFQHAVNHIYSYGVLEQENWQVRLTDETTAGQIRQHISDSNYVQPKMELRGRSGREQEYVISMVAYLAQLEERTANEAEYELHKQYRPGKVHPSQYIYEHYGYEILAATMNHINAMSYGSENTVYLDKLAAAVPELGLISADVAFQNLPLVPRDEAAYFLNVNGPYHTALLCRVEMDGREMILPSRDLVDWVERKTGSAPFDWDQLIQSLGPQKDLGSLTQGKENSGGSLPDNSLTMADIPAEVIVMFDAVEAGIRLGEEYEKAGIDLGEDMESLAVELEVLEEEMGAADEIEALCQEIEDLSFEAESLQDDLASLADEYEEISGELEFSYEDMQAQLEDAAQEANDEMDSVLEDTEDMSADELESLHDDLQSGYEDLISECQTVIDDAEDELQSIVEEIDAASSRLEEVIEQMEELCSAVEDMEGDLESVMEEAELLSGELEILDEKLGSVQVSKALDREYDRLLLVRVTDSEGSPVSGIPVYYGRTDGWPRLAGKTDAEGTLETAVSAEDFSGWEILVGPGGVPACDLQGYLYEPLCLGNEYLKAEVQEDRMVFALKGELELEFAEEPSATAGSGNGHLRVVLRQEPRSRASLPVIPESIDARPFKTVSWIEYYDAMFREDDQIDEEHVCFGPRWKKYLTADRVRYYGVHLIPLDPGCSLPRVKSTRYFAPLFRMEKDKAVPELAVMDDFASSGSLPYPYTSYGFDLPDIPAGHYMMAVLLPQGLTHFREITLHPGETLKISAESWTGGCSEAKEKRVKYASVSSSVFGLDGELLSLPEEGDRKTPVFALAVDAAGKEVWSVAKPGALGTGYDVPVSVTYKKASDVRYPGAGDCCRGQIYLVPDRVLDVRLLPVNYQYRFSAYTRTDKDGNVHTARRFDSLEAGRRYAITGEARKNSLPVYAVFLEEYRENGETFYRTVRGQVDFELRYPMDDSAYGGLWAFEKDIRQDIPAVESSIANVDTKLYQRNFQGSGTSYSLRYLAPSTRITGDTQGPGHLAGAVRLTLNGNSEWAMAAPAAGLTGTAVMTRRDTVNGERRTAQLRVEAERVVTPSGILLRFVFKDGCSAEGHKFVETSRAATCTAPGTTTLTCTNCGVTLVSETGALGHMETGTPENDLFVAVSAAEHARYCLRCGELVDVTEHEFRETAAEPRDGLSLITSRCATCGAERVVREPHTKHDTSNYRGPYGDYERDADYHWKICRICGQSVGGWHRFETDPTGAKRCTVCGYAVPAQGRFATANTDYICPHKKITVTLHADDPDLGPSYERYGASTEWFLYLPDGTKKVLATGTKSFSMTQELLKYFRVPRDEGNWLYFRVTVSADLYQELRFAYAPPLVHLDELPSTCMEPGYAEHYVCYCGKACAGDGSAMAKVSYEPADHCYTDACDEFCNVCGEKRDVQHPFSAEWRHFEDNHFRVCTGCSRLTDFGPCVCTGWIVDGTATCSGEGKQHTVCVACQREMDSKTVPAGHDYMVTAFTAPACGARGSFTERCSACGETRETVMPEGNHVLMKVPETTARDGKTVIPAHYVCGMCKEETMDRKGNITLESYMRTTKDYEAYVRATRPFRWWIAAVLAVPLLFAVLWFFFLRSQKEETEKEETEEESRG